MGYRKKKCEFDWADEIRQSYDRYSEYCTFRTNESSEKLPTRHAWVERSKRTLPDMPAVAIATHTFFLNRIS